MGRGGRDEGPSDVSPGIMNTFTGGERAGFGGEEEGPYNVTMITCRDMQHQRAQAEPLHLSLLSLLSMLLLGCQQCLLVLVS